MKSLNKKPPRDNCSLTFQRVTECEKDQVLKWLDEPHVREFWDNSLEHRKDIDHFIGGRKGPSPYFDGVMSYWIGSFEGDPFCFLLTSELKDDEDLPSVHQMFLSQTGRTTTIDFCIGNLEYLGKGLAGETLKAFMSFYVNEVDPHTDIFFIDPSEENPRAQRVYEKAGFREVGKFTPKQGVFQGSTSILMVCPAFPKPRLVPAEMNDYPMLQHLARYYVYDISRFCTSEPFFNMPKDGQLECFDLVHYFTDPNRYPFRIMVRDEPAGFALLHTYDEDSDWVMGEFFILRKFQGMGIGEDIVLQIFEAFPGRWSVAAIPQNTSAIRFWDTVLVRCLNGKFGKKVEFLTSPASKEVRAKVVWRFNV